MTGWAGAVVVRRVFLSHFSCIGISIGYFLGLLVLGNFFFKKPRNPLKESVG
jgi:hypothetical protein